MMFQPLSRTKCSLFTCATLQTEVRQKTLGDRGDADCALKLLLHYPASVKLPAPIYFSL